MATFVWSDFLETTKSVAVPEELFSHVSNLKLTLALNVFYFFYNEK